MSNFLEEFGKRNFQNNNPNKESSDAQIPLTGPVTNPNTIIDPSVMQRSFQDTHTNMWNEFLNSWDEISKGDPKHKLLNIQNKIDELDEDPNIPQEEKLRLRNQLLATKTASLEEIAALESDVNERPVDMDYTQRKNHFMNEEDSNPLDALIYETPNEFGGSASGFKYQIAGMLGAGASAAVAGTIGGPIGTVTGFVGGVGSGIAASIIAESTRQHLKYQRHMSRKSICSLKTIYC
jgi:hypothetical protein